MSTDAPAGFYVEFGSIVRQHRERVPMTQEGLGRAIGLSRASIVNIEKGRQHVALHQLCAIADTLGINAAALLPANSPQQPSWVADKMPPNTPALLVEWAGKIVGNK